MVKFLSGDNYNGQQVPVCTYWSTTQVTDSAEDYALIESQANSGNCIANAFFARSEISCFNDGQCNGEGKCLPCTKYKYDGMRLGITHSPPLDILRQFDPGLTEEELKSPNLSKYPAEIASIVDQDQTPFHILIRNIQAQIAKCCRWNQGNGQASEFFLATIIEGTETLSFIDVNGQQNNVAGIRVTHPEFPDEVGTFFPVGTVVVAGFADEPSFYLEPRTGLVKPGEGVIFSSQQESPVSVRLKQKATSATRITIDITSALAEVCNALTVELTRISNLLANAQATNNLLQIDVLTEKGNDLSERQQTACDNATNAQTDANTALSLIDQIVNEADLATVQSLSADLADTLNALADKGDAAVSVGLGGAATTLSGNLLGILRQIARDINQASFRSFTKCQFFYDDVNVAAQWNNPEDGSLPCNGVRTDCDFYTAKPWQYATDANLEVGKSINAEVLQELRWRSEDWARFPQPEEEFRRRFSTPFIWAFKGYVEVSGEPDVEDMLLYRSRVLFGRDDPAGKFDTIQVEKVEIVDFDNFVLEKSKHRIEPGSNTLDKDRVPEFPTLINGLSVPTPNRLSITHPRKIDNNRNFIYRTWSPNKNKLTVFGTGTPEATVYLVNETALQDRDRYHTFLGTRNFEDDFPTGLPGAPDFVNTPADDLLELFIILANEKRQTDSSAPLGFDSITVDPTGFWQARKSIDLVHNKVNKIYAFIFINDTQFIFDNVEVDYRFLHSIPVQTSFSGKDFTMHDTSGSTLAATTSDVTKIGQITAEPRQVVGLDSEAVRFGYGYYGLRFIDRGLTNAEGLNADNDLQNDPLIGDVETGPTTASTPSSSQVTSVGYNVVEYRKTDVSVADWYLVDDCGSIMIKIEDTTANRVLPLPDSLGTNPSLQNVLVNGGSVGAVIAQFAIESASIIIEGERKKLVQLYRDPDGDGLPANYVLLGPSTEVQEAFGRPDPNNDSIEITYVYLQAQSNAPGNGELVPANSDEVVDSNFNGDQQRVRTHSIEFDEDGKLTVGAGGEPAGSDGTQTGAIRNLTQEYVWVFTDSQGRPIGRKYSRLLVMYYGLACINIEMYYGWEGTCSTYGLIPDQSLVVGDGNGSVRIQPRGTTDPNELQLGFRLGQGLIGSGQRCIYIPSCGDHEFLGFGRLREEFEVIVRVPNEDGDFDLKAVHVGAGAAVQNEIVSSLRPQTQFNIKRGPMWYPYTACERPRYIAGSTVGPAGTASTELINEQTQAAGFSIGANILRDEEVRSSSGAFGNLPPVSDEAYRGPDLVDGLILDIHPSLRACSSAFTYGNKVLDGRVSVFGGAARKRGAVAVDIYAEKGWILPQFGNLGRNLLFLEVSDRRGDYLTDENAVGFRWMPVFPERGNLAAGLELFGEELETQVYRQIQTNSPAGSINETVSLADDMVSNQRFQHKEIVRNSTLFVDYPFLGYFPLFLSDNLLGSLPENRRTLAPTSDISTMWAWREQEKTIGRASAGSLLTGFKFVSPDYILDHRGLEVRLRPDEGTHNLRFRAPEYDQETGEITSNAIIQLDTGPEREIVIDFVNKSISLATQTDTVYDTSLELGDSPFPCQEGTLSDNENLFATCSCQVDTASDSVDNTNSLPSRFMHLDEVAPEGYFAIYESTNLRVPFSSPLQRQSLEDPCCQCVYYIRGLFATLDVEYLPTTSKIDPVHDGRISGQYTWSRVPHGDQEDRGIDGSFASIENLADNYLDFDNGSVFVTGVDENNRILDLNTHLAAFFPSRAYALQLSGDGDPIEIVQVSAGELKPGAIPAIGNVSQGEDELIILAFRFDTYTQINSLTINFFAGNGWEVPIVRLAAVDPDNRGSGAPKPTLRTGRQIAETTSRALGTNVPNSEFYDPTTLQNGISSGVGVNFRVTLRPSYLNTAFWNRYAMEFLLIFDARGGSNSMGIAGIDMVTSAFLPNTVTTEQVQVWERKYYRSEGTPGGGQNPEAYLVGADSASAYWRGSQQGAIQGSNKYRAYAWGEQLEDNQSFITGSDPKELESLQAEEYRKAAQQFTPPFSFQYQGYMPQDESNAILFYQGSVPSWTNTMTMELSSIDEVFITGDENVGPLYGVIPDRTPWHAPGHAWTFTTEDTYLVCDASAGASSQVVNFNFAHLHDNLEVVETASFWEELPSGFTRLLRSTLLSPDPTFGQGSTISPDGDDPGGTGQTQLLDASSFEGVSVEVLEAAGFRRAEDGSLVVVAQGGE